MKLNLLTAFAALAISTASISAASALPVAPAGAAVSDATGVEQAAYMGRKKMRMHHRMHRRMMHRRGMMRGRMMKRDTIMRDGSGR